MSNGYFRKAGVAAIAAGVVTMAAWRAPQASSILSASPTPTVATVATSSLPPAVAGASYAPVVERVMPAVVTIRVEEARRDESDQSADPGGVPALLRRPVAADARDSASRVAFSAGWAPASSPAGMATS